MLSSFIHRDHPRRRQEPALDSCPTEGGKLELLSAMDIFRDLSEAEVDALMDSTPMRTAPKGTIFYGAEDGPEVLFLLKSGKVELYRESPDGKKLTLANVEQGSFFGEMSLVGQRLLGTCALALEDSVICALSRHDVEALILEHTSAAFRIIEVLAQRLQQSRDALHEMVFNDVTGRVAGLLLRLDEPGRGVVDGYSHQDLASMVGCLRESLTGALDGFKRTGALQIGRRRIEIVDRAQLEQVVAQRSGGIA